MLPVTCGIAHTSPRHTHTTTTTHHCPIHAQSPYTHTTTTPHHHLQNTPPHAHTFWNELLGIKQLGNAGKMMHTCLSFCLPWFSYGHFKMVSTCTEKPLSAPPCLSEVSPTFPLQQFQCLSDWQWLSHLPWNWTYDIPHNRLTNPPTHPPNPSHMAG